MLFYGNPCGPAICEAMSAGHFGCIVTPKQYLPIPPGARWIADNGKFGKGYPGDLGFLRWLETLTPGPLCQFVVVPDAPFNAAGTLDLYPRLAPAVRGLGFPCALAGQNGMESMQVPWDDVDVICLGGSTEWKRGLGGAELAAQALAHGKPVHTLRANSYRALAIAAGMGCVSADGTFFTKAPDTNLPRALAWNERIRRRGIQGMLA